MSCEHLIEQLKAKMEELPEGSGDKVQSALYIQYLTNSCRVGESRTTHTSRILNTERDREMDEIWYRNKQEAEEYLASLSQ